MGGQTLKERCVVLKLDVRSWVVIGLFIRNNYKCGAVRGFDSSKPNRKELSWVALERCKARAGLL